MKFDAIVGNPTYMEMDGGAQASAKPIYNRFVKIAKNIKPDYISMISPSRWFAGGKGSDDFREEMLNDKRMSKIVDFFNTKVCFPNTSTGGGINYFLWYSKNDSDCNFSHIHDGIKVTMYQNLNQLSVFIRYNKAIGIIEKVNSVNELKLSSIVSSRNPFRLSSNERGNINNFENSIALYSSDGKSYINKNIVNSDNPDIIIISKITSEHAGEPDKSGMFRVLSRTELIRQFEKCTDSYLIVDNYKTEEESIILLKYLKSRFSRFLLLQAVTSINLSKDKFDFVPLSRFHNKLRY